MNNILFAAVTVIATFGLLSGPAHAQNATAYVARLQPMNTQITGGDTTGEARFTIKGDALTIAVQVKDAPPGITHWQHFHGYKDDRAATCPAPSADANRDGIIDLIETEPAAGTTMVPFTDNPVAMDVPHGTYPKASTDGAYTYEKTVSLKALQGAFAKDFDGGNLDLDRRVVFIHGVPADTKLPPSVATLGPLPPQTVLPIACGRIERVR